MKIKINKGGKTTEIDGLKPEEVVIEFEVGDDMVPAESCDNFESRHALELNVLDYRSEGKEKFSRVWLTPRHRGGYPSILMAGSYRNRSVNKHITLDYKPEKQLNESD